MKPYITLFNRATRSFSLWVCITLMQLSFQSLSGQTNNYFGTSGALSGNNWSTNPAGPYTSAFNTTGGGIANFQNAGAMTGGSITVAGINATASMTFSSISGTISNQSNGIITIDVASGVTLDFSTQNWTSSTSAGYNKTGDGILAMAGNTYGGGFTLSAGTIIVRGVNAMGGAASNTLTINGGTIAANATRDLSGKYAGGITIGGNFTLGATTGLASSTANLTFSNDVSLGAGTSRAITLGGTGTYTFGGAIGGAASNLTINSSSAGTIQLTGANTYTGLTTVNGGTLRLNRTGGGTLPATNNAEVNNGGTLRISTNQTLNNLTVASGGSLIIDAGATLTITGTLTTTAGITNTGSLQINGTLQINAGGFVLTNAPSYGPASTLIYNGPGSYNVSTEWTGNSATAGAGVPQNVTIQGGMTVNMPNTDRGMAGNLNIVSGALVQNGTSGDLYLAGDWSNAGTYTPNNRAVLFNGNTNQSVSKAGGETFAYLVVNKAAGLLNLSNNVNINGTAGNVLQLLNGNINTGANELAITWDGVGAILRTSGHVIGNLRRAVNGNNTYNFPVGTAAGYTPVSVAFTGASGDLTANANDGTHPNFATYGLSATKYVNRFWNLTGSSFSSANATFTYLPADLVGGLAEANVQAAKFDGGNWTQPATTTGTNSFTASGLTSFSGFMGGEALPPCNISSVSLGNIGPCNGNGTPDPSDDFFSADVTVAFSNKPGTGTLNLSGSLLGGSVNAAVGSVGATSHVFNGLNFPSNGSYVSLTAAFSAVSACTFSANNLVSQSAPCSGTSFSCGNDNAANNTYGNGWFNNSNGGSNFGPWQLFAGGNITQTGHFIGSSAGNGNGDDNADGDIDRNGASFGLYANSNQLADAIRDFATPMQLTGSSLSFYFDNGNIQSGGTVGFAIRNASNEDLVEVFFAGGNTGYSLRDGSLSPVISTGLNFTDEGLFVFFWVTGPGTYSMTLTRLDGGSATFSGPMLNPSGGQVPSRVRFFNFNAGAGQASNVFVNSLSLCSSLLPLEATARAVCTNAATGEYYIEVSSVSGGSGLPYAISAGPYNASFTGATLLLGPFTHSGTGNAVQNVSITDQGQRNLTLEVTEVICGLPQNSASCDCDPSPQAAPRGIILSQAAPGSYQSGGTSGRLQGYILYNTSTNAIVRFNGTGLFQGLNNGNYGVYAINYQSGDAAAINAAAAPGNSILPFVNGTGPVAASCYVLCGPATYTVRCPVPPRLVTQNIAICEGAGANLATLVTDLNNAADRYYFYEGNAFIRTVVATNGAPNFGQNAWVNPAVTTTYTVYAVNFPPNNQQASTQCSTQATITVTVNPVPQTSQLADIDVCPAQLVTVPAISVTPSGSLTWTNSNPAIGLAANGSGNVPSFSAAANNTANVISGTITYYATLGNCISVLKTFTIDIFPKPAAQPQTATVCSGLPSGIVLAAAGGSAPITGYSITAAVAPGLTGTPTTGVNLGANAIAGDVFVNKSGGPLNVTYTVTPSAANGCAGAAVTATLTVLPEPVLNPISKTICSGEAAGLTFADASGLAGVSYNWAAPALPTGLLAIGNAPSAGPGSGINDAFINTTANPIQLVYTISTNSAANCNGASATVTLTIQPAATATLNLNACENAPGSGVAQFDLTPVGAVASFFDVFFNPVPAPQSSGDATYIAWVPGNPCGSLKTVVLTVDDKPAAPAVTQNNIAVCDGGTALIAPDQAPGQPFIVGWEFEGNTTAVVAQGGALVNGLNAGFGPGINNINFFSGNGSPLAYSGASWSATASSDPNDYLGIGVSAAPGYVLNLDQLIFDVRRSGTGPQTLSLGSLTSSCSITGATLSSIVCNGVNAQFNVSFTAAGTSGIYQVVDGNGNVLASGNASPIAVTVPNASGQALLVSVRDAFEPSCASAPLSIALPVCTPGCNELFISEYVEGSSNNKAIEIFNPTGCTVNLAGVYTLAQYFNGNASASQTTNLTGSIPPGGRYVVVPTNANATLLGLANQSSGTGWFNGNDAIALLKSGVPVDVFGQIGFNPGTAWVSGAVTTVDRTLRRKAAVTAGDSDGNNAFDPAIQWDVFNQDDFTGLGSHSSACVIGACNSGTCSISGVAATTPVCVGNVAQFSVSFSATGGSGLYRVVDGGGNILATGTTSPITVITANAIGQVLNLNVRDAALAGCQGTAVSVNMPNCSAAGSSTAIPGGALPSETFVTRIAPVGLSNVAAATLRIFGSSAGSTGGTLRFDNMALFGTVAPTPLVFNFYDADPGAGPANLLVSGVSTYSATNLSAAQSPKTFWVTFTGPSGCESDAVPVTVTVNALPAASASDNSPVCENSNFNLSASGGTGYSWSGPNNFASTQQNPSVLSNLLAIGTYTVTVTDANGCSATASTTPSIVLLPFPGIGGTINIPANAGPVSLFSYLQNGPLGQQPETDGVWTGPVAPSGGVLGMFDPATMPSGVYTYGITRPSPCLTCIKAQLTVNVIPVNVPVQVQPIVALEGPYDGQTGLMRDQLRATGVLPLVEPYSALGVQRIYHMGGESILPALVTLSGPNAIVDWVLVELRDPVDPSMIVANRAALLQRDGDVVDVDGVSPVTFNGVFYGNYFVVIQHRNHLSVMTNQPMAMGAGLPVQVNFKDASLPVFGANAMQSGPNNVRMLYSGDADTNGQVQNADAVYYWIPQVGSSGYRAADYNLDGQVQNTDHVNNWIPNAGRGSQVPR